MAEIEFKIEVKSRKTIWFYIVWAILWLKPGYIPNGLKNKVVARIYVDGKTVLEITVLEMIEHGSKDIDVAG